MKIGDIINPWGALRAARKAINGYERALGTAASAAVEVEYACRLDSRVSTRKIQKLEDEIKRLEKIIADGHYRNPETGRLGRRGEVFAK